MSTSQASPLRILVAEDVAVNRELIRLFLQPYGHRVEAVFDGFAALEAVRRVRYDIVLMDMQMPGMDGLEATRAIRSLGGGYASMPIVALSANIIADQIRLCLDAGMTDHLSKPFTSEALNAVIERHCRSRTTNAVLAAFVEQAGWGSVKGLLEMMLAEIIKLRTFPTDDVEALAYQAHAVRGAASALGYGDLAAACRELEMAAREGAVAPPVVQMVFDAADQTRQAIEAEIARAA